MFDLYFEIRKRICPYEIIIKNIPPKQEILDIGCGQCVTLEYILKNKDFVSYTGIDKKIKKSNKTKKWSSKNLHLIEDSIENCNIDFSKFDTILMIDVMHHIKKDNQKIIIEKILSKMKIGSTLIYKDISNKNLFKGFANKLHDLLFNLDIIHYYQSKKIIEFAEKSLKITKIKKFNIQVLWYDHEFLIINK